MVGKKNVDLEGISELLDIKNLQNVMNTNAAILFPLYSKKLVVQESDKGKLLCRYEIDRNLVDKSNAIINIDIKNVQRPHKERVAIKDTAVKSQNNKTSVSIAIPENIQLTPHDHISIKLKHEEIGEIRFKPDTFLASEILRRPYYKDPLTETFKFFTASDFFKDYLKKPDSDERKQVASISWLFTLIGFRSISLGIVGSQYEQIKRTQPNLSCDILAIYKDEKEVILAIIVHLMCLMKPRLKRFAIQQTI